MNDKRVALVTGANKGIGFKISRQLGQHGFTVVLAARDEGKINDAASRLRAEGRYVRVQATAPRLRVH